MSDDNVKRFPIEKTGILQRGVYAQPASGDSDADPQNPNGIEISDVEHARRWIAAYDSRDLGPSDESLRRVAMRFARALVALAAKEH